MPVFHSVIHPAEINTTVKSAIPLDRREDLEFALPVSVLCEDPQWRSSFGTEFELFTRRSKRRKTRESCDPNSAGTLWTMYWQKYLAIVVIVLMQPLSCVTSSDPLTSLCGPVCWEEDALAEQCTQDRCQKFAKRPRARRRCEDACYDVVVPCWRVCNQHALNVLDRCQGNCSVQVSAGDEFCQQNCFTHNMMTIKARKRVHSSKVPTPL
nr:hypothetical protein BaRGS_028691 [Batillaria attramentaria]